MLRNMHRWALKRSLRPPQGRILVEVTLGPIFERRIHVFTGIRKKAGCPGNGTSVCKDTHTWKCASRMSEDIRGVKFMEEDGGRWGKSLSVLGGSLNCWLHLECSGKFLKSKIPQGFEFGGGYFGSVEGKLKRAGLSFTRMLQESCKKWAGTERR